MPATSAKQKKFFDAAAHNPAFAKKVGVATKVAKEYSKASKGQTFKEGGEMKESKAMMKKEVDFMKKKGAPKAMIKHEMAEAKMARGGGIEKKGKTKGTVVKMARGGGIEVRGKTKGKMLARGGKC